MTASRKSRVSAATAVAVLFAMGPATADIVIDGTDPSAWSAGPPFKSTLAYPTIGNVTLTSNMGTVNLNENFDGPTRPSSALSLSCDGIGVDDDEITGAVLTGGEVLEVGFENPGKVTNLFFLDLYTSGDGNAEEITASFFDTSDALIALVSSQAPMTNTLSSYANGGYLAVAVNVDNVKYFRLSMTTRRSGSGADDMSNDAAWAGATVEPAGASPEVVPMPIPAAVWLFGSALLGIAGIGYRRSV
jgi:hypothetical protein